MKAFNLKKAATISTLLLLAGLGSGRFADAQDRNDNDNRGGSDRNYRRENVSYNPSDRYRVVRDDKTYLTDGKGADLLRQSINQGYAQGVAEGRSDRERGKHSNWNNSDIYKSGSYGYKDIVDRKEYRYYFREGFQRGYEDGFNNRFEYGYNNGGTLTVFCSLIGAILEVEVY